MSRLTIEEWNEYFAGHWNFPGVRQNGHLAMFPEELPARLIKMFSFVGETVLDPFLGSGTTSFAARNLSRNSIGYEINSEYIEKTKKRLGVNQPDILGTEYLFLEDSITTNLDRQINKLPYIFKDTHKLDKKIDPKKLQFGSRIDQNSGEREEYYYVKEIISPILFRLNNNLIIRLIGVKEKKAVNGEAIAFLQEKLKRKKVFIKFDNIKHDKQNNLLCYLYLKNKTFINARLIKEGLADVDTAIDFKYKSDFLRIRGGQYGKGMDT